MPDGTISKKETDEKDIEIERQQYSGVYRCVLRKCMEYLSERPDVTSESRPSVYYGHARAPEQKESEKQWNREKSYWISYAAVAGAALEVSSSQDLFRKVMECRLAQLENAISSHCSAIGRLEASIGLHGEEDSAEPKQWPAFASQEFEKIVENRKGLENAGEDKSIVLYHIMEIETLLGKVERKARAADREYEARLAASLRDICRIHEPADLSNKQIACITGSLQALVEGWGALNREKVKWIRKRLLEVGLTWLPVTKKAQKSIDEAKNLIAK